MIKKAPILHYCDKRDSGTGGARGDSERSREEAGQLYGMVMVLTSAGNPFFYYLFFVRFCVKGWGFVELAYDICSHCCIFFLLGKLGGFVRSIYRHKDGRVIMSLVSSLSFFAGVRGRWWWG